MLWFNIKIGFCVVTERQMLAIWLCVCCNLKRDCFVNDWYFEWMDPVGDLQDFQRNKWQKFSYATSLYTWSFFSMFDSLNSYTCWRVDWWRNSSQIMIIFLCLCPAPLVVLAILVTWGRKLLDSNSSVICGSVYL